MTTKDSGVMNIKKKVANLKQELDEANDRANSAESILREKEVVIDKVSLGHKYLACLTYPTYPYRLDLLQFLNRLISTHACSFRSLIHLVF